jgi:hypothetical protein
MTYSDKCHSIMITAAVLSLGCVWLPPAMAQTVASRPDGPVACNAFQRVGNGSWTVLRPATIYPEGMALSLAAGETLAPNQMMNGIEVTAVLDRNCGNR